MDRIQYYNVSAVGYLPAHGTCYLPRNCTYQPGRGSSCRIVLLIGFALHVHSLSLYLGLAGVVRKGHGGEQLRARKKARFIPQIAESAGRAIKVERMVSTYRMLLGTERY